MLRLPSLLERNFSLQESLRHSVWVDSPGSLGSPDKQLVAETSKTGGHSLRGNLNDNDLSAPSCVVTVKRHPEVTSAWTRDTRGSGSYVVRQRLVEEQSKPPGAVVLVVDGTEGMQRFYPAIAQVLTNLPNGVPFALLQASDGVRELSGAVRTTDAEGLRKVGNILHKSSPAGGHDNVPALVRGWDMAAAHPDGVLVWLHGPQPEDFGTVEELRQRFERRPAAVRLVSVQVGPGPNRVLEKLDGVTGVDGLMRTAGLAEDLQSLFGSFKAGGTKVGLVRDRVPASEAAESLGHESSLHLARLWAFGECRRLHGRRDDAAAMKLASLYQLVTPVSGAVVLEAKEQYARAGLEPVPPSSVPMVPEPSVWALLMAAFGLLWAGRFWARSSD